MLIRCALATAAVTAAVWCPVAAASGPTVTMRESCAIIAGQKRFGVEATASGLTPGTMEDYVWDAGAGGSGSRGPASVVRPDGTLGPIAMAWNHVVPVVRITIRSLDGQSATPLVTAYLAKPCQGFPARG